MKRPFPWNEEAEVSSESGESSSGSEMDISNGSNTKAAIDIAVSHIARDVLSEVYGPKHPWI